MDIDDGTTWPFSQKLLMAMLAFFLNVVLLNLLIAIMGDSYDDIKEARDKTDSLTRLEMISDAIIYRKLLSPNYDQPNRGYLISCKPAVLDGEENDQKLNFENFMKTVKNIQQKNEHKNEQQQTFIKNEVSAKIERLEEIIRSELLKLKPTSNLFKF